MGTRTSPKTAPQRAVARKTRSRGFRRGRGQGGTHHDPYEERAKPPSPSACPYCGLVHVGGRWARSAKPPGARKHPCPACRRLHDRYPAGFLRFEGELGAVAEDFLNLVRRVEAAETGEHPLERVMEILQVDGGWTITTTGTHLPRRLASALQRAGHRRGHIRYGDGEAWVRASLPAAAGKKAAQRSGPSSRTRR